MPEAGVARVRPGAKGGARTLKVRWGKVVDAPHAPIATWQLGLVGLDGRGRVKARKTLTYRVGVTRAELRLSPRRRWTVAVRAVTTDGSAGAWSKPSKALRPR